MLNIWSLEPQFQENQSPIRLQNAPHPWQSVSTSGIVPNVNVLTTESTLRSFSSPVPASKKGCARSSTDRGTLSVWPVEIQQNRF
jgi:hypothetical protein